LLEKYNYLKTVTVENIPHLWPGLEFALSVKTILNIKDCTLPFAGIILGPSSSNKTVAVEAFRDSPHTFYTDKFSPKSLVSHLSGMTEEQLRKIDLLPRLKNKFFLTPELAQMFSSRDDDLMEILGILTRILDGHGYESDSGAYGHRGYDEDIMFTWASRHRKIWIKTIWWEGRVKQEYSISSGKVKNEVDNHDFAQPLSYSSWRRHQTPVSLRPLGARSSHWYMPQRPSSPRA
jgi:hypothetical protein